MAENLGGISEDVSALIKAINAALPQSNTKKTVDIKVNGTKELKEAAKSVETFGAAVKTLDQSGADRVTKAASSIMELLSGKLKNAPVSSITTSLIEVFTKPDVSAQKLLTTVLKVQAELENVQKLSKKIDISLLTSSQLDSLRTRQSRVESAQFELSTKRDTLRREAYQKYEDIDVYQMARKAKRGKIQTAKEIAGNVGIDPNKVTNADGEQLQTYIRTLDLLKQLIDARKKYGEIHSSADANAYLKQEQQISKVFQELLRQEDYLKKKFDIKGDPLSAALGLDEQTVKANAQQAAQAYVNWFSRTLQTQLNTALADLDTRVAQLQGNIEERTERSAQRVEKNTKFARGRGNGGAGGGSGSGTGGIGDGTGEAGSGGTGSGGGEIGSGVQRAGQAVKQLSDELRKYIVSEDEAIDKIHDLLDDVIKLEDEMKKEDIDPNEYGAKFDEQEEKYKEILRYRANLIRQGYDSEKYDEEFGIGAWTELDKNTKDLISSGLKKQINDISSYVDSNPVTVKVETEEAKKKVDEIKKTLNELFEQSKTVEFGAVFDSRTGRSSKTYSGKDKQIDLAEAYAEAKKSGIQADTYFHTHPDAAKYAAFSLKDIETSIAAVKDGIRQSVLMVGDEVATMDVSSLAGLGQDFLKQFYASISSNVKNGLKQLRDNIAQSLSYGDVIDDLPMLTKQLQDDLKEVLEGEISEGRLSQQDADIIQPVINAAIDQVQQKLLEMIKSGEKLQGYTLINDSIQSIIDQVERSIASSDIKIDPSVLNAIITDAFTGLDDVFDQEKFKKMFDKDNFPLDKMALIQQKAISDALLQLGKEPEDFYKILTKDQFLGQVYDGENPKSKLHIDVSEAVNEINALKEVVASLKEQIQQLSETKVVVDVDELQAKLERAQEEIDELNHALAGTVSESSNTFLSEQLSEAEQRVRELSEEVESLRQQLTDAQQKAQQAPLDMGVLDKKVAELQYLHDKVRTIFDGKDGIINEDMTYDEKFNSAEVQRMIELLSQLSDAELKATMGIEGDEWVAEFRNNLQTEINLIRELQKEQQKVYDGTWPEDMEEPDLAIWRHLENIYDIVNNVTRQFESKLTPAVREFMSLLEGQVGADGMFSFLNGQNIDRYINDILSGAKTAKEAFADLENAFGWDTDRFASLIDGEVPQELKGLYDQLFSDVENRIKSAEQAADEFNAKLKEIRDSAKSVKEETAPVGDQLKMTGYHATRSKWQTESFDFGKTKAAQLGSGMYMVDSPEKLSGFLSRPGGGDVKQTELNLQKCFILTEEYISSISDINKILGTTFDEATSAKEVMSAIRKYNNTSKENSDNFRKSMLEMGYQGMYVGDHLANKNIDSEVAIYDEKLLGNLTTIPKPDFKAIIDGATQASKAVITLRKDLQDLTEASTFSDQSPISSGTTSQDVGGVPQQEHNIQQGAEDAIQAVDNLGRKIDETFAKKVSGTALVDDMQRIITLFHHSDKEFDAFDLSKADKNVRLGRGAYFGFDRTNMADFQGQDIMSQWYANVKSIFDTTKGNETKLDESQIESFIKKYLSSESEEYISQFRQALQKGGLDAIRAIKTEANKSNDVEMFKNMMGSLGYDAILGEVSGPYGGVQQTLKELNVLDPSKIFKIDSSQFAELEKIDSQIEEARNFIQFYKQSIQDTIEAAQDMSKPQEEREYWQSIIDSDFKDENEQIRIWEEKLQQLLELKQKFTDAIITEVKPSSQAPPSSEAAAPQQREQKNESEAQSVEQLIAEYERLGSVLNSLDQKHGGVIPASSKDYSSWNRAEKAQKEVADKLREAGMYYSPDQGKWVEDIVNLEDKYKELLSLIESGDTKAIAEMFKIDESSLGNLEVLKNNLKLVIDTLNAADGMSASGAKLSWWDGWLGGGRDLIDTDQLTGSFKTLGISDEIIERIAQAHRDAAAAAKEHAIEEEAAADATKNVVDAAGAQKVPGREQPSINPENTGETADMSALGEAVDIVTKAVDEKTMAFSREAQIVQESVQIELASLQRLIQQLEAIRDLSQNLPKIQLTGKDGTKANPIISPELIQSIEQLKTVVGDFDPAKLTALFSSIKNLKINENVSTRMTELATGFGDLREALDGWEGNAARTLEMITQLVQKANALKDVIKTANEQNVKQPKVEKTSGEKKEPEKPAQKSQDEIRADQLKAYNAALKEFQSLEKTRVQYGQKVDDLGAQTLAKRVSLAAQLDSIEKSWNDAAAQGVAKTKEMLDLEQERRVNAEQIAAAESKNWDRKVKGDIGFSNLQNRVAKLKEERDLRPDAFNQQYEEIKKKAKELSLLFPLKPFDEGEAENAKKMAEELGKMIAETRSAPEYKLAKDNYVSNLGKKMETWAANNKRAIDANFGAWSNMQQEFKQINTLEEAQNVSKMFDEFVAGANRAGQAGETFAQGLMKRFKSLGQYLLSFASFYRIIGVFKQAFNTVKQLDDALTEMRKVSDESLSSLQKYQSLSFNMADEVGTTAQQIQQSTADWLRLGESFEEAQKSARESTILLNVSEFENIDKATESLVSASQAYKDLDKIDIIDKLNNIGNNFSISTDQLATGLQNAAAVLMTQGNDIDEALALLTAGNAITQDISKTSAGIRTISLRISGTEEAKDEIQDMGEDVDDFVVRTKSKTDQIIRDYTAVASNAYKGVSVLDANGNLRNTYDILLDIAKIYKQIQAEDKKNGTNRAQALVETLAGKNRSNIAASILQNPEMLEEVYEASKDSAGSAQQELDKYLDSITGKVTKLQNAIQQLTFNIIDSEPLKVIVDLLTNAVKLVNTLVENVGGLNLVIGGAAGILTTKFGKGFFQYDKLNGLDVGPKLLSSIKDAKKPIIEEIKGMSDYADDLLISQMDKSVFSSLSADAQNAIEKVKQLKGENTELRDVISSLEHPITGVGGALSKVGGIAANLALTLGNMIVNIGLSMLASAVIKLIADIITYQDRLIEKGKEAQTAISDAFNTFKEQTSSFDDMQISLGIEIEEDQDIEDTISNIAEKYSELHEGVNGITNENISLTNDEYQQYLDTCNKLAEQNPSLVNGWDSQGNAILNLGTSADEARIALMGMYEAQQLTANVEIGNNLNDLYNGVSAQSDAIDKENAKLDKENERLIKQVEWDASHQILDLSGYTLTASVSESLNGQIVDIINNVLGPDAYDQLTDPKAERSIWDPTNNTMVYYLDQLEGITEEKVQQINDALANIGSDANGKIAENTAKKHANELRYADIWASVEGSVSQYLQTSKTFNGINDQIQSAILGNLSNVDLTNLGNYDTILDFVYGEILEPMDGLNEEVQEKLAEAFTLDTSEISKGEYVDKIAPMLQEIFGVDWLKWAKQLGFQDIIDELQSATDIIYAEFGNNLTKEQEDTISDMSIDMLRNAKRLLSERSYEPDDFSAFWRDLNKKPTKAPGTGTLTDIFNDEGYSKEASTFTSNLSEIKTAIEQVGESGSVASDEVTKLLETEVKFDSFELSGLSKAGTDVLSDWIKKLHEMADAMDLSDDAMKDFDQYIASIVASYGNLLDIDPQKFITSVVGASLARAGEGSSTGQVVGEITGENGLGERLQSENAEEILLLLNADGTLASGQIQQIVDQWDHYEILLNVSADAEEAERRIASLANDTAERSYREALNSSKEAIGEVLTAEDYSAISEIDSREYFTKMADADKALEKLNGITDKNSTEYYNASADYYNALTELTNLQVSSMERVKAQQESGANAINRQLEEMQNTRSALDAQITEATNRGSYADQGTYSTLAMLTSNMAKTQRDRYNFYSNLAENTSNKTWAIEWGQTAQEALNEALSLEADSLGYLVQPYVDQIDDLSKKYEDLSSEQSAIQDNLELREKKGYKTTARDYKRLLKNSKDQKKNIEEQNALLRKQRKAIQDAGGDWSDVQDQIESNNESIRGLNSSIFDYEQSIRTAALTEAQALASAIQTAMQEMASETGLSTDTILQLKQAFSDLKSMDISTLFYRTADGIKMSVNTLNTLIEAENTLKNNELDEQIRAQQEAMEKEAEANGTLTSAYRKMEDELLNLMNIRSQYFATYQEQLAAIDGHSLIELAKSTKNPLDRYNQSREYLKEAYEMYEKGQIGSDDFKAIASYFDVNGFSDEATFKANYDKYSKYFTEDATGLVKFWDDLVTAGVAAKDELGNYILTMGDVEKAAEAANVPLAVFQDIIMATNDYGADVAFVTSVQDGREQLAGLNAELRDEQVKLEQLKASGAEQSVIDKQAEVIKNVENSITNLQSATDAAVYSERRSFLEGAKGAKQLWEAYSGYRDDAIEADDIEARRFWEQMMRSLAEEYDLEIKPGFGFDQEGYDQLMSEVESELNSTEYLKLQFGVSDEDVTSAKEAFDNTFHHNRAEIEKATESLRNYSAAELLAINHADGDWSDGEKEIEEFAASLGIPLEQINALIIALQELGILKPEVEVEAETEDAKTDIESLTYEEAGKPIEKEVEIKGPSPEKLAEVEENVKRNMNFQPDDSKSLKQGQNADWQLHYTINTTMADGAITPKEVQAMSNEQIELHFGVSGADEVQKVRDYVAEIDAANGYDLTVHIDESQMSSLIEAINPENPIEVEVDDEPWTTFVDEVEGKELTVTVNTEMGTPNPNTPSGSTPTGNTGSQSTEINASYNFDNKSAESSIGDINNLLGSLDVGRTYITVDGAMAIAQINAFNNMISNLDVGRTYITIDGAPAIAQINAFNDLITNGLSTGYSTINVDTTLAQQVITDFNSSIDSVHDGDATVNVSTATALRNIGSVSSALSDLGNRYVSPRVAVTGVSSAISQLDQLIRQLNSLNGRNTTFTVTRKNYVVGGHMDEGDGNSALGTAHALGGAFAFGNAYASGQNWGVPDNEDALVNEVGQESIVIFCDDIR